jgi:hypothetical protein
VALIVVVGSFEIACTPTTKLDDGHPAVRARVGVTQGSAIAVTQDEALAVVTNRSDGVVSIVGLDPAKDAANLVNSQTRADIPFHPLNESKPWAAVIDRDDDTAYVLLRGLSEVVRVSGLHGIFRGEIPKVTATIPVGSEPTAIVITPSGQKLYVANWGEGTVSTILTKTLKVGPLDLNRRLSDELLLGPLVGDGAPTSAIWTNVDLELERRPGLAHPRALAITDDGDADDTNETLYATEFFAQPLRNGGPGGPDDLDHSREALVYPISLMTNAAPPDSNVISLSAVDVSFLDSEGNATACFPNQLYSAAASGDRLYITSVCASPKGPVEPGLGDAATNNFKTLLHSAVFVVNTRTNREVPSEHVVLTDALQTSYSADDAATGAVTAPRDQRMPLIPTEIVLTAPDAAGQRQAFVSAMGSSAVYAVGFGADGTASVGSQGHRFFDLISAMPVGLALLSDGRALVVDDLKPGLFPLDLAAQVTKLPRDTLSRDWSTDPDTAADEIVSADVREGRRLFSTGLTAWSFQGQGWSSCESCHPGGLSDGVTWRFSRGPRRTISLAGTYYRDETTRRVLLWGANIDEIHDVEVIARTVSGGVGGVVWNPYANPLGNDCRLLYDGKNPGSNGKTSKCPAPLPAMSRANGLNGSLAALTRNADNTPPLCGPMDANCDVNGSRDWAKGAALFQQMRCNACHAGSGWTRSQLFYEPGPVANGSVPFADPRPTIPDDATLAGMLGLLRSKQYEVPAYEVPDGAPFAFGTPGTNVAFRVAPASTDAADTKLDYVFGQQKPAAGAPAPKPLPADQLQCALRSVGTFPAQTSADAPNLVGVTVGADAPPVNEVRRILNAVPDGYKDALAFGVNGFNIPSLVGLATGAPYFHAGNARSLEELFDVAFQGHYGAMGAAAPSSEDIRNLVSYLLSIDETPANEPVPPYRADFDLCAQFTAP